MSIANTIHSINNHIENIYDTLEIAGTDTSAISKNIVNINSSLKERLKYYLANGLDVVWENWDKVNSSGEIITLNNTIPSKLKIELNGNTSQLSYSGKNLLNIPDGTYTGGDYSITFKDGVGTLSVTTITETFNIHIPINLTLPAGTYTLNNFTNQNYPYCQFYYNNTKIFEAVYGDKGKKTFTLEASATVNDINLYYGNTSATYGKLYPQIESGNGTDTFEKFVGGTASPNPDYPQDIKVVSGDNTIKVKGKNLTDYTTSIAGALATNGTVITSGVSSFAISGDKISFTTTSTNRGVISDYIEIKPNTDYVLSYNKLTSGVRYRAYFVWYDENKVGIHRYEFNANYLTSPANAKYLRYSITIDEISTASVSEIQLEIGQSATIYEPYQSQEYKVDLPVENLFNTLTQVASDTGVTTQVIDNNNVKATYNGESNNYRKARFIISNLKANTDYTFKALISNSNSSVTTNWLQVRNAGNTDNIYNQGYTSGSVATFNTGENTSIVVGVYAVGATSVTGNTATWSDIQLEEGTKANSFRPYGTTPIELCKIGDYQDYFRKSTGKNLFGNQMYNGIINQDGSFSSSTTRITNASKTLDNTFYLPKGTYTLSISDLDYCTAVTKDSSGNLINDFADSWKTLPFTFTTTQDTYFYFSARKSSNANINASDYKPQIEEGNTATEYEPYGKVWCKHKENGKSTDTVTSLIDTYTNITYAQIPKLTNAINYGVWGTSEVICNKATYSDTTTYDTTDNVGKIITRASQNVYWVGLQKGTTLEQAQTKLANLEIYYILKNSTNEAITDTTLINQLDELEKAMSYQGITNISQDNNDESFIIDATTLTELGSITVTRSQPLLSTILVQNTTDSNEEENENNINEDISEEQPDEEINEEPEMR